MSVKYDITFFPADKVVRVFAGTTVLAAAMQHGIKIRHVCGGKCSCTTCQIVVEEGMSALSPMDEKERRKLSEDKLEGAYRLSCQCKVYGNVKVRVPSWLPASVLAADPPSGTPQWLDSTLAQITQSAPSIAAPPIDSAAPPAVS